MLNRVYKRMRSRERRGEDECYCPIKIYIYTVEVPLEVPRRALQSKDRRCKAGEKGRKMMKGAPKRTRTGHRMMVWRLYSTRFVTRTMRDPKGTGSQRASLLFPASDPSWSATHIMEDHNTLPPLSGYADEERYPHAFLPIPLIT